jgi:SAM-dependent methyltransferase
LVARYWAERNTGGPEIPYFQRQIERNGGPALDAGCGTGRLLIPFLRAGLEVDGCDISADMLALCRETAGREGLNPQLYQQALHELALPRPYQTIVVCGVFGLASTRQQDLLALQRLHQHLNPGGLLLLDNVLPYESPGEWRMWLQEARKSLPKPWPDAIGRQPPPDGSDYELYNRLVAIDPLEQKVTRQMRTLLWRDGQVVDDQVYTLTENRYFYHELRQMLAGAGFTVEAVHENYTEAAVTPDSETIVFLARKQ